MFGTPPREIAAHVNGDLAQRELFSAVPKDDVRIKGFLTPRGSRRYSHITDADELIAELARLQDLARATTVCARREAELRS
jgi:hypothetical protein